MAVLYLRIEKSIRLQNIIEYLWLDDMSEIMETPLDIHSNEFTDALLKCLDLILLSIIFKQPVLRIFATNFIPERIVVSTVLVHSEQPFPDVYSLTI